MEPALQAAHPEIRTYAGRGADGSTHPARRHPAGLPRLRAPRRRPGLVRRPGRGPRRRGPGAQLLRRRDAARVARPSSSATSKRRRQAAAGGRPRGVRDPGGIVSTRTYRLAFVTDPTYADLLRGTDVLVLAAKTTLINRVNEVYNDDLAIKFVLVAGTDTKLNLNTGRGDGAERALRRQRLLHRRRRSWRRWLQRRAAGPQRVRARPDRRRGQLRHRPHRPRRQRRRHRRPRRGRRRRSRPTAAPGCRRRTATSTRSTTSPTRSATRWVATTPSTAPRRNCSTGNRNATRTRPRSSPAPAPRSWPTPASAQQDNLQPHSDPYFSFASIDEINATTAATPGQRRTSSRSSTSPASTAATRSRSPAPAARPRRPITVSPTLRPTR